MKMKYEADTAFTQFSEILFNVSGR